MQEPLILQSRGQTNKPPIFSSYLQFSHIVYVVTWRKTITKKIDLTF